MNLLKVFYHFEQCIKTLIQCRWMHLTDCSFIPNISVNGTKCHGIFVKEYYKWCFAMACHWIISLHYTYERHHSSQSNCPTSTLMCQMMTSSNGNIFRTTIIKNTTCHFRSCGAGAPFDLTEISAWINDYLIIKCGIKLLFLPQISTVEPLKFVYG